MVNDITTQRIEWAGQDVAKWGKAFKANNTKMLKDVRKYGTRYSVNAANELYFATRKAARLVLAQEAK